MFPNAEHTGYLLLISASLSFPTHLLSERKVRLSVCVSLILCKVP